MKFAALETPSVLILGLGQEGLSSLDFLCRRFPDKRFGVADQAEFDGLSGPAQDRLRAQSGRLRLHLGADYLNSLADYDVVIKSPGIPPTQPAIQRAAAQGKLTSHTALFFSNCPGTIIGITGTKGKSTTAALTHAILRGGGMDARLVGNIGRPPLDIVADTNAQTVFVAELSSHQLEGLRQGPHIAVVLNIMPDHLDYYPSFEDYVRAKLNIARFQSAGDYLIYNAESVRLSRAAADSPARTLPFSARRRLDRGCFVSSDMIVVRSEAGGEEPLLAVADIPLPGDFNLPNVLAAVATARLLGVSGEPLRRAVRGFEALEHRFERLGPYRGISFYNAPLATVPEVTLAHLAALGPDVQTVLLGGHDRHLDFSELAGRLVGGGIRNLLLFPTSGARIWQAVRARSAAASQPAPHAFFVNSMERAVRLAYAHTAPGKICLHSPASPSFGLFRDYRERGRLFKDWVRRLAGDGPGLETSGPMR